MLVEIPRFRTTLGFRFNLMGVIKDPTGLTWANLFAACKVALVKVDFDADDMENGGTFPSGWAHTSPLGSITAATDGPMADGFAEDGAMEFSIPVPEGGFRWEADSGIPEDGYTIYGITVGSDSAGADVALFHKFDEPIHLLENGNFIEITTPRFAMNIAPAEEAA